eukprot:5303188-Amphidinium_carterae.1
MDSPSAAEWHAAWWCASLYPPQRLACASVAGSREPCKSYAAKAMKEITRPHHTCERQVLEMRRVGTLTVRLTQAGRRNTRTPCTTRSLKKG